MEIVIKLRCTQHVGLASILIEPHLMCPTHREIGVMQRRLLFEYILCVAVSKSGFIDCELIFERFLHRVQVRAAAEARGEVRAQGGEAGALPGHQVLACRVFIVVRLVNGLFFFVAGS
ncbi:hypothetical protein FGO68_gene2366 [Halteria grandinella]|uniref:Uncharacterized protein n=1 Tax=Halteria grandinella TaxID=5974 RepID=A0A8J8T966_HALGN|nr:hypothetical protein FGO68_gene2366 [Halteria grandinella]